MSQPDFLICEYPLPDPEMQGHWFDCAGVGGWVGEMFTLTKEGKIPGSAIICNFTGDLHFEGRSKDGELFFYLAHFIDGQLQSIRRADLIKFESREDNPGEYPYTYCCEHLGFNNGWLFQITAGGRLLKISKLE